MARSSLRNAKSTCNRTQTRLKTRRHQANNKLPGHCWQYLKDKHMIKRTVVVCTCLAFATLMLVSACSHKEEVRVERETSREMISPAPAPSVTPGPVPEVVVRQPLPPRMESHPPQPSPSTIWVPGSCAWNNNTWVWDPGQWERPPDRTAAWVPGQ